MKKKGGLIIIPFLLQIQRQKEIIDLNCLHDFSFLVIIVIDLSDNT